MKHSYTANEQESLIQRPVADPGGGGQVKNTLILPLFVLKEKTGPLP